MLRTINSALAAAVILLLPLHILIACLLLTGFIGYLPLISRLGWLTLYLGLAHVLLSLYLWLVYDRPAARFPYVRANRAAWLQRLSGLALAVLVAVHLNEAYIHISLSGWPLVKEPTLGRLLLELLLLLAVTVHLWESLPRLLLTWGLTRTEDAFQRARRLIRRLLLALTILVALVLLYYFLIGGRL